MIRLGGWLLGMASVTLLYLARPVLVAVDDARDVGEDD